MCFDCTGSLVLVVEWLLMRLCVFLLYLRTKDAGASGTATAKKVEEKDVAPDDVSDSILQAVVSALYTISF